MPTQREFRKQYANTDRRWEAERVRGGGPYDREMNNGREKIVLLAPKGCVGAEIGVSTGQLSRRFLEENHLGLLHSVDTWDYHGHTVFQYKAVCEMLIGYDRSKIWRLSGQEFAKIIPDDSLGFIYIDCFAHTGQDDGTVLTSLWPKLSSGGLFSGDDYDGHKWPLTYGAVNRFANDHDYHINVESDFIGRDNRAMDQSPTWWFIKR